MRESQGLSLESAESVMMELQEVCQFIGIVCQKNDNSVRSKLDYAHTI